MPNTKSAKKALRASERRKAVNSARKNRIRTFVKKVDNAIKSGNEPLAREALKALEPEIMRGVTKKVINHNTASRKLSRLYSAVKKISKLSK
jgi:small subunit ribosomal protein S20